MVLNVNKNLFKETGKDEIAFHILDFNRPEESRQCLESIKKHVKFPHKVLFYSNGGEQDYTWQLKKEGLINILLSSDKNEGSSIGTIRLAEFSPCKYFFNLQCDNFLIRDIQKNEVDVMISVLKETDSPIIDLAYVGKDVFSERAFFSSVDFYLRNPHFTHAGTGPFQSNILENSEQAITRWLKDNTQTVFHWTSRLIADNGKYAVLEIGGGILKRRTDSQELKIERTPTTKAPAFNLSDEEWDIILAGQWAPWRIPEKSKEWVFLFYSDKFENEENRKYLK